MPPPDSRRMLSVITVQARGERPQIRRGFGLPEFRLTHCQNLRVDLVTVLRPHPGYFCWDLT